MNRRGFLTALAGAFVAPDPERLLWVQGKKLISIPTPKVTLATFPPLPLPEWYKDMVMENLRNWMIYRPESNRLGRSCTRSASSPDLFRTTSHRLF